MLIVSKWLKDAGWDHKVNEEKGLLQYSSNKHVIMHLSAAVSKTLERQKEMKEWERWEYKSLFG